MNRDQFEQILLDHTLISSMQTLEFIKSLFDYLNNNNKKSLEKDKKELTFSQIVELANDYLVELVNVMQEKLNTEKSLEEILEGLDEDDESNTNDKKYDA